MFSAPTAIRVLKKQDPEYFSKYDVSSLRHLFLAGEPLDEPTHRWISEALRSPVIDHYWQTETGWPVLSAVPGVEKTPIKFGSPSFPVYGYDLRLLRESRRKRGGCRGKRRCRGGASVTARVHDNYVGRRRTFPQHLFLHVQQEQVYRPLTGACTMKTATISSSGGLTTSSTWRGTASARARSRKRYRRTPTSPK